LLSHHPALSGIHPTRAAPTGYPSYHPAFHPDDFDIEDSELDNGASTWFPSSQACDCCHGYIYGCAAIQCRKDGRCVCAVSQIGDERHPDLWLASSMNCSCCQGYVYNCKQPACEALGECGCRYGAADDEDETRLLAKMAALALSEHDADACATATATPSANNAVTAAGANTDARPDSTDTAANGASYRAMGTNGSLGSTADGVLDSAVADDLRSTSTGLGNAVNQTLSDAEGGIGNGDPASAVNQGLDNLTKGPGKTDGSPAEVPCNVAVGEAVGQEAAGGAADSLSCGRNADC